MDPGHDRGIPLRQIHFAGVFQFGAGRDSGLYGRGFREKRGFIAGVSKSARPLDPPRI